MARTYTEAQRKATKKWSQNQKNISVRLPKEQHALFTEYAKSKGKSLATLIKEMLEEAIKKEQAE